jgi:hypothetical protein
MFREKPSAMNLEREKALPVITAEEQRRLLDRISDEQAEEDPETWIQMIRESRTFYRPKTDDNS